MPGIFFTLSLFNLMRPTRDPIIEQVETSYLLRLYVGGHATIHYMQIG
jgi:hypothetical protein